MDIEKFANIDKKFAWSFLGFVLAVIFGTVTIYTEFIRDSDPNISVELLSDTNVLDLKENLPELKILYGDVDIKSLNKTLSVLVFRVRNTGASSILNSYYDEKAPFSIELLEGDFLKVEKISASNDYLNQLAFATQSGKNLLRMPNVILDAGDGYTYKALVLHGNRPATLLKATGKIARVKSLAVTKIEHEKEQKSFFYQVISGTIVVQLLRSVIYFFLFFIVVGGAAASLIQSAEYIGRRSRRRNVAQFKIHHKGDFKLDGEPVFQLYISSGLIPLVRAQELINDPDRLKRSLVRIQKEEKELPIGRSQDDIDSGDLKVARARLTLAKNQGELILKEAKVASIGESGEVILDKEMEKFISKFVNYITIKEN